MNTDPFFDGYKGAMLEAFGAKAIHTKALSRLREQCNEIRALANVDGACEESLRHQGAYFWRIRQAGDLYGFPPVRAVVKNGMVH